MSKEIAKAYAASIRKIAKGLTSKVAVRTECTTKSFLVNAVPQGRMKVADVAPIFDEARKLGLAPLAWKTLAEMEAYHTKTPGGVMTFRVVR